MASYIIIAKQISWGGDFDLQDYHGEAVVSEEAFFLVIQQHVFDAFTDLLKVSVLLQAIKPAATRVRKLFLCFPVIWLFSLYNH